MQKAQTGVTFSTIKNKLFNKSAILHFLLYLTFVTIGVFLMYRPPVDPDFGWHLKYGEYIVENKGFLRENTFSYSMPDYEWANSYWIAQAVFYVLFDAFGYAGMSLVLTFFFSAIYVFIISRLPFGLVAKTIVLLVGFIVFGAYLAPVRPLMWSSILMLILIYVLIHKKEWFKFLPILFLFWANLHADFTLGLFVLFLHTLNSYWNLYKDKHFNVREIVSASVIPLLCVFVTLINPYGILLWETLLKETHPFQFTSISEWTPLNDDSKANFYFFVGVLGFIYFSIIERWRKMPYWYTIALFFFATISVRMQYFMRVAFILGLFNALPILDDVVNAISKLLNKKYLKNYVALYVLFLFTLLLISAQYFATNIEGKTDPAVFYQEYGYPYDAVQFVKEANLEGKMFNPYNWGGFLIWHLPEHKTFIDGRMPSWRNGDESVFEDFVEAGRDIKEEDFASFDAIVAENDIGWVILQKESALAEELSLRGWPKPYEDSTTIIYKYSN